jgi:alginate O-acetyltransferase complex protein AlgI
MSASSLGFLAFSIVVSLLHAAWANQLWRQCVMLLANLAFLASFSASPPMLIPGAAFLLLGYGCLRATRWVSARHAAAVFVVSTVLAFCWLKKYWFLSFLPFLPFAYLTVGLSYVFFRVLGLIIDAQSEPELTAIGPVQFFNFAVNFPTLLAGPIDRYQNFALPARTPSVGDVSDGIQRIAVGFCKVLVLSTLVGGWQTAATQQLLQAEGAALIAWASVSFGLYPVFLYFNFSGYTDIVLGVGRWLGRKYPENFDAPFSSRNFIEFWSRWHMSLSFWLRDYVYTPLLRRGMMMGLPRSFDPYLGVVAYFVTFFLIGIWHGSTVIFALYGLLLALGVSGNKLFQTAMSRRLGAKRYRKLADRKDYQYLSRALTYTFYCFCMICFWNTDLQAIELLTHLRAAGAAVAFLVLLAITAVVLNVWEEFFSWVRDRWASCQPHPLFQYIRAVALGVLIFLCVANAVIASKVDAMVVYQAF